MVESVSGSKNLLARSLVVGMEVGKSVSKNLPEKNSVVAAGVKGVFRNLNSKLVAFVVSKNDLRNLLVKSLVVDMEVGKSDFKSPLEVGAGAKEASRNRDSKPVAFVVSKSGSRNSQEMNLVGVGALEERGTNGRRRGRRS
jgi:hypothetical protein